MDVMRGNAHAAFKFITLIFVIIVTMQEQTQKGGGNRTGMRYMSCVSCACEIQKQNPQCMFSRAVRILPNLRISTMIGFGENKLIFDFFFRVPGPESADDKPDATIRREPAKGRDNRSRGGTGKRLI